MKRFLMLFTLLVTCLGLFAVEADAKRLGGGGSVGKQRTMDQQSMQRQPTAAPAQAAPAPAAAAAQSNRSKWLGPLAGLAIGAGLAALFASMGLGEGMGMLLMIILGGIALMFVISMFRKKSTQQPAMQYAGAGAPYNQPEPTYQPAAGGSAAPAIEPIAATASSNIPADFPVDAFLRSAKTSFIRLQAANDRKDVNDIREYTTPEMYAELSMQIQARDDTPQKTDVTSIEAHLLEVANEGDYAIASVRMSGRLSENGGAAESFDEVWHVQKNLRDDKAVWLLAGIQQIA